MNENVVIKRGTEIELDIESLAYGGKGVAKTNNFGGRCYSKLYPRVCSIHDDNVCLG